MVVTVEGVVGSDVCRRGERVDVEWTPFLQRLAASGLIRVVGPGGGHGPFVSTVEREIAGHVGPDPDVGWGVERPGR